jgi:hypothetical protein
MQTAFDLVLRALFHLVSPHGFDVNADSGGRFPKKSHRGSVPRLTVVPLRSSPSQGNDKNLGRSLLQLQE